MGMAITYDVPALPPMAGSGVHVCRFGASRKRVSPAGGNRREVNLLVDECRCGMLRAVQPLDYWNQRWINRYNDRISRQNACALAQPGQEKTQLKEINNVKSKTVKISQSPAAAQQPLVRRHRCQFLRDNGKPCGRIAKRNKERVFLDSSCGHGRGWCEVYACEDHAQGRYIEPNVPDQRTGRADDR